MEKKYYYNVSQLEEHDRRIIIDKKWYHSEKEDPKFDKCDTYERKNEIKNKASYIYKKITSGEDNKCTIPLDSAIVKTNYYTVTFNTLERIKEDGTLVYEKVDALDYEYAYNPYYYERLSKELNKLAKKDNLYLDISLKTIDSQCSYVAVVSTLTKEQFENTYNISLEDYYDALNEEVSHSNTKEESEFRKTISELKKAYIKYLISDINKGFDKEDVEMDGYRSYLKIRYDFRDLPNQEEILREFGFTLDKDNYLLKLSSNKEYQPVLKQ